MDCRNNPSLGAASHSCSTENKHSGVPSLNIKFTSFTMNLKNPKETTSLRQHITPLKKKKKEKKSSKEMRHLLEVL